MARGQNQSTGRAARSEGRFTFQGATGQAGAAFMRSQVNNLGTIDNVEDRNTAVAISNALNEIADKLVPTEPTTLAELYDTKGKAYDRLISVRGDEAIGNKKVAEAINLLASETDKDKRVVRNKDKASSVQEGLGRGRRAVIGLANDLMMRAFVQGQRNFSGFAQLSISDLTPQFGAKTAAKLVDLALREGYDRMKRAGMTWAEEDPRLK